MAFGISASTLLGGASLVAGLLGANAASDAASAQAEAAQSAQAQQMAMFNTVNNQNEPWRQAGQNALSSLSDYMGLPSPTGMGGANFGSLTHQFGAGDLNANLAPNYAFQLGQGQQATNNLASVGGGLVGGNALKGIQDYTQNAAGSAYQQAYNNYTGNQTNIFNRLSSIAGLGQQANNLTGQVGANLAGNAGSATLAGGAANAAGIVGSANALNGGIGGATGSYYLNSLMTPKGAAPSAGTGYAGYADPNMFRPGA